MNHVLELPKLFQALQALFSNPLGTQMQAYQSQRNQTRASLQQWASEVMAARNAVHSKTISVNTLAPEIQRLVLLGQDEFYSEIIFKWRKFGFEDDARRYDEMRKRGTKRTREVKDEHGNVQGSETVTDGERLSNAVEFSL